MDDSVIFPSPNWFQASGLAVSTDNWLIYGGPSKSLCILEPINTQYEGVIEHNKRYQAHVVNRAHNEKIVSVDISVEWPEKRLILTGSIDGTVKQWSIEKTIDNVRIKSTQSHDIHQNEREEVSGVGYSNDSFAITVGSFGNVVKWELNSNVVKTYKNFLKSFKPNCIACSRHIPLNVAVGTRQGVVFLLDLEGKGKVVYKVRAQDDEILNLSWCPQYEVLLRKSLSETVKKSSATERLEKIRSEPEVCEESLNNSAAAKSLPEDSFDESVVEEDDMFDIYKDHEADEFGHKKYVSEDILVKVKEQKETNDFLAECLKLKEFILKKKEEESSIANLVDALDKTHVDSDNGDLQTNNSPDNNEIKSDIKDESEIKDETEIKDDGITSAHIHKHLLATIGKFGAVKLWSKSGKLVASCNVPHFMNKGQKNKGPNSITLYWYKPNVLLLADGKGQLLECNPLKTDCKNKIQWSIVHSLHKRGLYCIASNAPRVQTSDQSADVSQDDWIIYTTAQDRNIICYSLEKRQKEAIFNTCGGYLYTVQSCPYDAKRIAVSVGDGAVRVWEADTLGVNEDKLSLGKVTTFWQNVQGKVLTIAWHPTKENLLAFGTGESRIGLIDTSGKSERPAKTLTPVLRGGIYSLCWGENYDLYVCAGGELVMYRADKPERDPMPIPLLVEGAACRVSAVCGGARALLCGGDAGVLAALGPHGQVMAVTYVFNKMIHSIEWHPQQTSSNSEESPYKNLIAVSSLDKSCNIAIVEYAEIENEVRLRTWKDLMGHTGIVLQVAWNPHKDGILLSTSQDGTVRVWDISQGACVSIFGNHLVSSLGATWSAFPQLQSTIISGGADCCLRVWKYEDHPPEKYIEIKHEVVPRRERRRKKNKKDESKAEEESSELEKTKNKNLATAFDENAKKKNYKKFLLPIVVRNMSTCSIQQVRRMAQKYLVVKSDDDVKQDMDRDVKKEEFDSVDKEEEEESEVKEESSSDEKDENSSEAVKLGEDECLEMDFTKLFGTTNEFNEVLDLEMRKHLEYNRLESWVVLAAFRGHVAELVREAARRDALCPFILSLAPAVSFKYWKDVTQMYLAQIERLDARNEGEKMNENKKYGGAVYRRAALLLSLHDVKGAVAALLDARLFKEAYVLARARHMDSIAEDVLRRWANIYNVSAYYKLAAIGYLALGDVHKAVASLAKLNDEEFLLLATELAKAVGQKSFAGHIEDKRSQIQSETPEVDDLKSLPSKIDLMKDDINVNSQDED